MLLPYANAYFTLEDRAFPESRPMAEVAPTPPHPEGMEGGMEWINISGLEFWGAVELHLSFRNEEGETLCIHKWRNYPYERDVGNMEWETLRVVR